MVQQIQYEWILPGQVVVKGSERRALGGDIRGW